MASYDDGDDSVDKDWAKRYLLDPLHEPEPNQLCGPGSSFRTPNGLQRSLSVQTRPTQNRQLSNRDKPLPTPPGSSSPSQSRFRPRQSPSQPSRSVVLDSFSREEDPQDVQRLHNVLVRSQSVTEGRIRSIFRPRRDFPPSASLNRSKTVHTAQPLETRWNQGTILTRRDSVSSTRNRPQTPKSQRGPRSSSSVVASPVASPPFSSPVASPSPMSSPAARTMELDKGKGIRRSGSLSARYPGDMSHRPLDTIKQEQRAAMRAPYLHNPSSKQPADIVDTLDQTGIVDVPYHHEGPYDATMANRNRKKPYSPLDAVKDSNEEAIKATPRDYIQDSLTKHVPLQGTAVVPSGMRDLSGRTMEYEEGEDLVRDSARPAGGFKLYEIIPPREWDLNGKGEPSYTTERDREHERKQQKASLRRQPGSIGGGGGSQVYEMQPQASRSRHGDSSTSHKSGGGAHVRQRSVSNADEAAGLASPLVRHESSERAYTTNTDLRRRNTTGNKFAEGLKRRFGSLRRKKVSAEGY